MLNSIEDRIILTHLTRIADNITDIAKIMINLIIGNREKINIVYNRK